MSVDADEVFAAAGLQKQGNESIYERTEQILDEKMSELSVAHAFRDITFRQRIAQYESQKKSLVDELIEYQKQRQK